ncbi:MAG: Slp family lipoprotein [Chromatiales bacterium]|nr:Slp family lipoprotein [Chromatiales bacterium]
MLRTLTPSLVFACIGAVLCACVSNSPRFDRDSYDSSIAPRDAVHAEQTMQGRGLLWGGLIVASTNLDQGSEIEVLAYPLGRDQSPDLDRSPLGRFMVTTNDFLETIDFAPGRLITVAGTLSGTREGEIGNARYVYPILSTAAARIHLWPQGGASRRNSNFNFGLGIGIGL